MLDIQSTLAALDSIGSNPIVPAVALLREKQAQPLSTTNHLTGFDMVWAITENTVNSQLQWLQKLGKIPTSVKIGDIDDDGIAIGGEGEDEATIAPPTVSFDTGTAKSARLTISLTGGTVSFYTGFGRNAVVKKASVAGWSLVFNVNLNIAQISHDHIVNSKAVPQEVSDLLTKFDESMFSIQSIFMDFQNSDLVNYNETASTINCEYPFVTKTFATAMATWIGAHKGTDNPFVLGYPVSRKTPSQEVVAVFQPTGATMSTHAFESPQPNSGGAGLSTLNFLLVTGNRDISAEPGLRAADAGSFHRNLVQSNDIDGKGIISRDLFLNNYVRPLIVQSLQDRLNSLPDYLHARQDRWGAMKWDQIVNEKSGVDRNDPAGTRAIFIADGAGWTYHDHVKLSWHESGSHSHDRESEQDLQVGVKVLTAVDASNAQRITVDIALSVRRYEWDQVNQDIPPFKSNVYMGKGWASTTVSWKLRLQLVAGDDGKIAIRATSHPDEPLTESGTGGIYNFSDWINGLFGGHKVADDWRDNALSLGAIEKDIVAGLDARFREALDHAAMQVIMPAKSTFFYKNIQLNADGDVEVDLTYKSAS